MKILEFDSVKSTNAQARGILDSLVEMNFDIPTPLPDVIVARKQTQGKGRSGNWFSPEDCGIYMSVIRDKPLLDIDHTTHFSVLEQITKRVGYAVLRCLVNYFHLYLSIEGINDIYLADRKLAGILCEYHAASDKLIVGVGLNTFRPRNVRKDLVNKITYLNDWSAEHLIIHNKLVQMIADEIIKI